MIKYFFFITKKPEISSAGFRNYYETHHVPLIKRLLPMFANYERHFLDRDTGVETDISGLDFDVITEVWFADMQAYEAFLKKTSDPAIMDEIRADEAHFLISEATRSMRVDTAV